LFVKSWEEEGGKLLEAGGRRAAFDVESAEIGKESPVQIR